MPGDRTGLVWQPYILITLLVVIAYFPTFSGDFILDDNPLVKNNPHVKDTHSFCSYMTQEDGISHMKVTGDHTGYYRPLINLTYWLDYKVWGMSAPGFRVTNVILHLLCCFVLFRVIFVLVGDRRAAFWVALLFALHPVNTESVSWIVSRNNILVTLFSLLSLFFYMKKCKGEGLGYLAASLFFFAMAILSKEFGLMMLPALVFYQRFLSRERPTAFKELMGYLPFVAVVVCYFFLRKTATGSWLSPTEVGEQLRRLYFAPYIVTWNLKFILFPYGLHSFIVDYPSGCVSREAVAGFLYVALLGVVCWTKRKDKVVMFSIALFHMALFPVLNIIPTSAVTLFSMRWLYFPMVFLALAVAQFLKKPLNTKLFFATTLLSLAVIYAGVYSHVLNKSLWHDEETFFRQEVLHFKNYYYAGGLAEDLLTKKEFGHSEKYFKEAISRYPNVVKNYINYSALMIKTGRPGEAVALLERARPLLKKLKERAEWENNMGTTCFNLGNYFEALQHFRRAVGFRPEESQFWGNLGAAHGSLGEYNHSISALREGLDRDPHSVVLKKNLAVAYSRMGDHTRAAAILEKIPREDWGRHGVDTLFYEVRGHLKSSSSDKEIGN